MSGGDDDQITFDSDAYGTGKVLDTPPPLRKPDPPPRVRTAMDALLGLLNDAANSDDAANNSDATAAHLARAAQYDAAMAKFPANEAQSEAMLTQATQAAGEAMSAAVSAVGGLVGSFAALPEALAQAGTAAMQTGLGALSSLGAGAAGDDNDGDYGYDDGGYDDFRGTGDGEGAEGSSAAGGGGGDVTLPATFLAPPALPAPAPTFPAAASPPAATAPAQPQTAGQPGMGGMAPMPMATGGVGGGNDKNAEMKRLQPPTITNGRPVMGRFTPDRLDRAPIVTRVRRVNLKKASEGDKDKEEG